MNMVWSRCHLEDVIHENRIIDHFFRNENKKIKSSITYWQSFDKIER